MRYRFIERERVHYPVTVLCRLLAVSRSSYSAWRPGHESQRTRENRQLSAHIRAIYTRAKQRYGSPRIHDALRGQGWGRRPPPSRPPHATSGPEGATEPTTISGHDLPPTDSVVILRPSGPMKNGSPISLMSRPARAGCIWRWCWICMLGASLVGP